MTADKFYFEGADDAFDTRLKSGEQYWDDYSPRYKNLLKKLARRIVNLPEDDETSLQNMQTDFKTLIETFNFEMHTWYFSYDITSVNHQQIDGDLGATYDTIDLTAGTWVFDSVGVDYEYELGKEQARVFSHTESGLNTDQWQQLTDACQLAVEVFEDEAEYEMYYRLIYGITYDTGGYQDLWEDVLEYERLYAKKKSDLIIDETSCYQDVDSEYYWAISGGLHNYLPAYTNVIYYSSYVVVRDGDKYVVSHNAFGLHISVPCGGGLLEGDQIHFWFDAVYLKTYQVGDAFKISTIAANPLLFDGGLDSVDEYTFSVVGSVDGEYPVYVVDKTNPSDYSIARYLCV